jgi:hypothetical protein
MKCKVILLSIIAHFNIDLYIDLYIYIYIYIISWFKYVLNIKTIIKIIEKIEKDSVSKVKCSYTYFIIYLYVIHTVN